MIQKLYFFLKLLHGGVYAVEFVELSQVDPFFLELLHRKVCEAELVEHP
jgi:hypothetical protein